MVTTTQHRKYAVYNGQGAERQNCRDNATAENSLLGAKRHKGWICDVVLIQQIRMDCSGCPTALGCQLYNSLHGSESASRRVPLSRPQHHRDISRQINLTAANCRFKQRRAHDEPLWSKWAEGGFRPCQVFQNLIKATQCRSQWAWVRLIRHRQSKKIRQLNSVKSAFLRRQVPGDESLRAPNPLRNPYGSFWTLAFVLRSHRKLKLAMGQNSRIGKKGWTYISLIDYFMVTRTIQTWFYCCSTVSYRGSLLLRLHLVVRGRGNDNWHLKRVPTDLRWCIRHYSSVEKSAGLNKFGLSAGPRFASGRKPVHSNQYGFELIDPQAKVLKYCFPWSKPINSKRVLIHLSIYEMSAKKFKRYIKCFDVNIQTWVNPKLSSKQTKYKPY